jgi:hypothetical protein
MARPIQMHSISGNCLTLDNTLPWVDDSPHLSVRDGEAHMAKQAVGRKPATTKADNDRLSRSSNKSRPPVSQEEKESLVSKLVPILVPIAFSLLAAMTYGLLRSGYVRFYSTYGITPEDAGISQQQVITGALRYCLAAKFVRSLGGWAPAIIFGLLVFYSAVWVMVVHFCARSRRFMAGAITTRSRILLVVTIYLSTLLVILLSTSYYFIGEDQADASRAIDQLHSVHPGDMVFLMVQADPASVIWLPKDKSQPLEFPTPETRIVYLGHNEKMAVIFDPSNSVTWRVPEDSVLIRILPNDDEDKESGTKI